MDEQKSRKSSNEKYSGFESALREKDPVFALRSIAQSHSRKGLKQKEIYNLFLDFYCVLQDSGRGQDEAILGDVMDMIVDEYAPFNLNLPK